MPENDQFFKLAGAVRRQMGLPSGKKFGTLRQTPPRIPEVGADNISQPKDDQISKFTGRVGKEALALPLTALAGLGDILGVPSNKKEFKGAFKDALRRALSGVEAGLRTPTGGKAGLLSGAVGGIRGINQDIKTQRALAVADEEAKTNKFLAGAKATSALKDFEIRTPKDDQDEQDAINKGFFKVPFKVGGKDIYAKPQAKRTLTSVIAANAKRKFVSGRLKDEKNSLIRQIQTSNASLKGKPGAVRKNLGGPEGVRRERERNELLKSKLDRMESIKLPPPGIDNEESLLDDFIGMFSNLTGGKDKKTPQPKKTGRNTNLSKDEADEEAKLEAELFE